MLAKSFVACLTIATSVQAETVPRFTGPLMLDHQYTGGWEHFVGGGVAAFDCNDDAFVDLYVAGGAAPAQLFINKTQDIGGTLRFTASPGSIHTLRDVTGAYPLDIDGDGILDLAVLRAGADQLLRGTGDCQFEAFGARLGFTSDDRWTTAFSATWEPGNTLPTLAFATYVDRSDPDGPFGTCDDTLLYRPANGSYGAPIALKPGHCALSALFTDWNRDGRQDLRISNDRHYYARGGQEQMWAMETPPREYGAADGWQSYQLWGMGIASRDLNQDGYSDVFLTSMGDQRLQYFDPESEGPLYQDAPYETGTSAHRPFAGNDTRPSTGWHAAFGDVQNDGYDDLFIAKGNVEAMNDAAMQDPNNLLIQQADGRFAEAAEQAGILSFERSRGAALVDMNQDGLLDLAVVNRNAPVEVYQNQSDGGNWLQVQLRSDGPNGFGIGSYVEVRAAGQTWTREITIGGGHASGTAAPLHFGLGQLAEVEVRAVTAGIPTAQWQTFAVNQTINLMQR